MATSAASVNAFPLAAPADTTPTATPRTQTTTTPGQFQAALTAAGQSAQAAQATAATDDTTGVNDATDDTDTNDTETDATVNGLIGLVNQFQFLNPAPNAAVAQANGTAAPEVPPATTAANDLAARTRADDLLLNNATAAAQTAHAPQTNATNLPTPTNTPTTTPTPEPSLPAVAAQPAPLNNASALAARAASTPNIPPPAPIVANLTPTPPVPADLSAAEPAVNGTGEATPASALPAMTLGDRPATAGERFAAIASAGAQLVATTTAPASGIFENALDEATKLSITATPDRSDANAVNPFATPAAYNQPSPVAPAPAPATPTVAASPAAQVAEAVVSHAQVLERPGSVEFQMRLNPAELGHVQINLVARGDEVHGQVLVAHEAVRQLLESQLPELRQRLEASGVNIQQFSIATDAGTGGGRNPYREAEPEFAPPVARAEAAVAPRARIGRTEAGTLDVTV